MSAKSENLHPVPAMKFCWLVELFLPSGNSLGLYHTGFTGLGSESRATSDPYQAKQYESEDLAARVASTLYNLQGEWRAVEHGFYTNADSGLNTAREDAIHADMEARFERERARFTAVVSLMGEPDEAVAAAISRLNAAIETHPTGTLVLTHGPFNETSPNPETTFRNLIAMSWQDDDDGSQFNELLWERSAPVTPDISGFVPLTFMELPVFVHPDIEIEATHAFLVATIQKLRDIAGIKGHEK